MIAVKPINILIVDDDEDDFFITSEFIREIHEASFNIEWCFKYKDALQAMQEGKYDIYLVDYRLGVKTGLDLIKDAIALHCEEPIVLLTGKGSPEVDKMAMHVGAMDYLVKPELNPEKLERSIRYAIGRSSTMKALSAQERKYRTIFEQSKDAVFLADENLQFFDVNTAMLELMSTNLKQLLSSNLYQLMRLDADKTHLEAILQQNKEVDDLEIVIDTLGGATKYCILSASIITEENKQSYIQGIIHDITNIRKAERATLLGEKLASAGRLVRTLAHEVRNPLNNINLSIEQLQTTITESDALYLDIIYRNSQRISALITELLNSSRPSELKLSKVSLQSILDNSLATALDRITLHKVNVKVHYADEVAYILANKEKLQIAFLNIIINAVEAMQPEVGVLRIDLITLSNSYRVVINDNGIGIPEENLTRLFEPYFTEKRNGMGLGLAATLNILQSHKGTIEVLSQPGLGTSFIMDFPEA